ncbi:MAG: SprB repeat-containing protein, partial [Saprospiraceae bacterium]
MPQELLTVCDGSNIVAKNNNDFIKDTGDIATFIFCSDSSNPTKTILRINQSGIFPFDVNKYKYDSIYYLVFIIGRANSQGLIDLNHPCLSISNAQRVVFRRKTILSAGPDQTLCIKETFLAASGNFIKGRWTQKSGPGQAVFSFPDSLVTQVLLDSIGIYIFKIEAANMYCLSVDEIKINYDTVYRVLIQGDKFICGNKEAILDAGDQLSYKWSTGDTTRTIKVGSTGRYCVSVTNSPECLGDTCVEIKIGSVPSFNIVGKSKICKGSTTLLQSDTEFFSYLWSNGLNSRSITADTLGSYCLTVTNSEGCTNSKCFQVTSAPSTESNRIDSACDKSSYAFNGKFYQVPGSYDIVLNASNQFGCDSTIHLKLFNYAIISIRDSVVNPDKGNSSGSITVNFIGGIPPLTYRWNNGEITKSINKLSAGTYTITVSDSKNCSKEFKFVIKSTVGVSSLSNQNDFSVFPNPILHYEPISWTTSNLFGQWLVELYDVEGKRVYQKFYYNIEKDNIYKIDYSFSSS